MIKPSQQNSPDALELAPGFDRQNVEGSVPLLASPSELMAALEEAFDYRGDVTLTRKDGSKVEGYIFDRRTGPSLETCHVRLMPRDSSVKIPVAYSDISGLAFTGRDTAAGRTWEAWVRKYWEKRAAGEKNIGIEPDSLE